MRTASSTASCAAGVWANTAVVTSKRVNRVRIAVLDARGTDLVAGPRGSRRSMCRVNTLFVAVKLPVHSGRIVGNPEVNRSFPSTSSSGSPQRRFLALTLLNQAGSIPSLVRIRLEEHENHHPGDRYIEPNGERPACDSAVHREPARQRKKERCQHHRHVPPREDYLAR